ncbi:MAG: hypothetical protein WCG90_01655 [Chitinophagia bacterium]
MAKSNCVHAQSGNVLVLKDRGITIKTFTKDSYIEFEFSNRQWITGQIQWVKNDSIQLKQYALQTGMTAYGTYGQDTLRLGMLTLHINEIRAFAKDKSRYQSVFANGTFLKFGGALYSGLNVTNSIINKEAVFSSKNIPSIAGGLTAYLIGRWMAKKNPPYRPIGKRFSVAIL